MPPASPSQRRKRGRPTASAEDEVASRRRKVRNRNPAENARREDVSARQAEDEEPPRKRSRKGKENVQPAEEPVKAPRSKSTKSRRSGDPSIAGKETSETTYEADAEVENPRKKRVRPSKASASNKVDMDDRQEAPRRSKRGRASGASQDHQELPREPRKPSQRNNAAPKTKRIGRSSPTLPAQKEEPRSKKRGRSSPDHVNADAETSQVFSGKKRPGRKAARPEEPEDQDEPSISQPKKGRRRTTARAQETEGEPQGVTHKRRSSGRKSKRSSRGAPDEAIAELEPQAVESAEEGDDEDDMDGLVPCINSVSQRTINSKWSPLDGPSIAMVTSLLHDAARPVLLRLKDERKQAHAAAALQAVSNRLRTKMTRGLPFPPASTALKKKDGRRKGVSEQDGEGENRLGELSFESAVDGVRAAQRRLTPLLHSVALLKREKENQEQQLRWDYEVLQKLERNSKEQKMAWRAQLKKSHPLVPRKENEENEENENDYPVTGIEDIVPADKMAGRAFADLQDPEARDLAQQAGSHIESMRANMGQIEGVAPAIWRTRAALQGVLHKQLDMQAYESVVLGSA